MGTKNQYINISPIKKVCMLPFLNIAVWELYYLKREQLEIIIGFNNGLLNSLFNLVKSNFSTFQIKNSLKIHF